MTKRSVLVLVKPSAEAMARWNDDAVRYSPNCRTGCSTQNHRSYAECCQGLSIAQGVSTGYMSSKHDAHKQGIHATNSAGDDD